MTVDLSPLVEAAVTLAAACIAACIPLVTAWLGRSLHIQNQALFTAQLAAAIRAGGGIAYHCLATEAAHSCRVDIRNAALAAGVQQALAAAPMAMARLGMTQAGVEALVTGELGRLLASDPTISPGPCAAPPEKSVSGAANLT